MQNLAKLNFWVKNSSKLFLNGKIFLSRNMIVAIMVTLIISALAVGIMMINTSKAFSNDSDCCAEHVSGEVIAWLETDSYSSATQANEIFDEDNVNLRIEANSKIDEFLAEYNCTTLACYAGDDQTYSAVKNDASYITVKNPLLNADTYTNTANPEIPVQERVVSIRFDESQKAIKDIISELENNPLVKFAEPNYIGHIDSVGDLTKYQYAYDCEDATGTAHNKAGMNVEGCNATDNIPVSDKLVAAVIDTGVDTAHPDIPFAGTDGGYDLTQIAPGGKYGYNATAESTQSEEAKDPSDVYGHGTHVAGSIAAKWDDDSQTDDKGVSGGASKCYILPVRIGYADGSLTIAGYTRATAYLIAAKQSDQKVNIKAANNSWSFDAPNKTMNENTTKSGLAGIISLFSSANNNENIDIVGSSTTTFVNNPYVLKVNSTNINGYKSNFSNYGFRTTDVCAPGTNILSTVPTYDIEKPDGNKQNLRLSDTRILTKDTDYTLIDDFEDASGKTNLQYYLDEETKVPIEGTASNPKGYESIHAIASKAETKGSFIVKGDLSNSIKQGEVNNLSLLVNTDTWNQETDNTMTVAVYDTSSGTKRLLGYCAGSTAGSGYFPVSVPVSTITDFSNVHLLVKIFYSDENCQSKNVDAYIDNIAMAHVEIPYAYQHGTSMATPACTGIAAIVANKFKNEPIEKIVARIKGGTNQKEWLTNTCYSGGIVDLKRASSSESDIDPVVQTAKMNSLINGTTVVELTGYFLGDNTSSVIINGQTATNIAYSQRSALDILTCTFTNPISGEAKITVNKNGKKLTRCFDLGDSSNLLETLPQPPKNDSRFDDFYNAGYTELLSVSKNNILINTPSDLSVSYCYKYDINKMEWMPSDIETHIMSAIGKDCNFSFLNSKDDTLYFSVRKNGELCGLLRYDAEKDQVIDYEQFSNPDITDIKWIIIEDKIVYLGNSVKNLCDVYSYNYSNKKLTLITNELNCGENPTVFKRSEGQYIFIDTGSSDMSSTAEIVADVYNVTLDDNGFKSEKSTVQAYPEQAKAYRQDRNIGYAFWNDQIITFGPAEFDTGKYNQNSRDYETYAYVKADSFSINANTGTSTALPKVMQNYKVANFSTRANDSIVYTSFIDRAGTIQIAKRDLGVSPTPTPPTPEPEKITTAATGDYNLKVPLLFIVILLTSIVAFAWFRFRLSFES